LITAPHGRRHDPLDFYHKRLNGIPPWPVHHTQPKEDRTMSNIEELFPSGVDPADLAALTAQEVDGIDFDAVPEIARRTQAERTKRNRNLVFNAGHMFQLSVALLAMDKEEMVELVRKLSAEHESSAELASLLPALGGGAEDALMICETIYQAQTRPAVAIAATGVEGTDGMAE
jgi:hypothetical protein